MEEVRPDKLREMAFRLLDTCKDVAIARSQDYHDGHQVGLREYFPLGHESFYQMVHLKLMRALSLMNQVRNLDDVQDYHERLDKLHRNMLDSIVDAINYLSFWGAYTQEYIEVQGGGWKHESRDHCSNLDVGPRKS